MCPEIKYNKWKLVELKAIIHWKKKKESQKHKRDILWCFPLVGHSHLCHSFLFFLWIVPLKSQLSFLCTVFVSHQLSLVPITPLCLAYSYIFFLLHWRSSRKRRGNHIHAHQHTFRGSLFFTVGPDSLLVA